MVAKTEVSDRRLAVSGQTKVDPRAVNGACVRIPSGDRCYVEGTDPASGKIRVTYESGLGQDLYPLHLLELVQASSEPEQVLEAHKPEVVSAFKVSDRVLIQAQQNRYNNGREATVIRVNQRSQSLTLQIDGRPLHNTASYKFQDVTLLEAQTGANLTTNNQQLTTNTLAEIAPHSAPIPHSPDPLPSFANQLSQLYNDYEAAEDVAKQAGQSALQHAYQCGEILLKAKEAVGHGGWEKWREINIISQRTGKPMPSSTATLFQRVYKHWEDIAKSSTVAELTLRDAISLLPKKKPKPNPPPLEPVIPEQEYTPIAPVPCWFDPGNGTVEGQAIAENQRGWVRIVWGEGRESDVPRQRVQWSNPAMTAVSEEIETGLAAIGLDICRPSITPEDFNRELWAAKHIPATVAPPAACQLCQHRTLTDGGDRYWCEMGEFDDTLLLKQDWMERNEGHCKSFCESTHSANLSIKPPNIDTLPEPETPLVRLKVKRGKGKGVEILSAIVQVGGVTHYLQSGELALEEVL